MCKVNNRGLTLSCCPWLQHRVSSGSRARREIKHRHPVRESSRLTATWRAAANTAAFLTVRARSLLGDTSRTRYWPSRFPWHRDPWIKHQEVRPPVNDVASFDPHLGSRARVFGLQRVTFKVQPFMEMSLGFAYTKSWLVSNSRQLEVWSSELLSSERFSPVACTHELVCLRRTAYYAFL